MHLTIWFSFIPEIRKIGEFEELTRNTTEQSFPLPVLSQFLSLSYFEYDMVQVMHPVVYSHSCWIFLIRIVVKA